MAFRRSTRSRLSSLLAAALLTPASLSLAQQPTPPDAPSLAVAGNTAAANAADIADRVWTQAVAGEGDAAFELLRKIPANADNPSLSQLRVLTEDYDKGLTKQAATRSERLATLQKELEEALAKPQNADALSDALKSAIEWSMLATDKPAVLHDARVEGLIERADKAAREAEAAGDWLTANELFWRLNMLLDLEGRYRDDVKRIGHRLSMLRLFVPERLYELRNNERKADGKDPLPPFNALGEDFREKIKGVNRDMVEYAINRAADQYVDRTRVGRRELLIGGLDFIRTMVTTADLRPAFPGLADDAARTRMLAFLDERTNELGNGTGRLSRYEVTNLLNRLVQVNSETIQLPEQALLREFGDGAMARLDDFSAVIWPDDLARFERLYQGKLKGIGVQIQLDEATQLIKVVTPLEGTPAQRAGVRAGDLIKKVDGKSALGLSLNQAVELITGREGTRVNVTMEREGAEVDFNLVRAVIPIRSVKGWKRLGASEDKWDWFIDREHKIAYIRLLQFQEETEHELSLAVKQMLEQGVEGIILDLRFNPGGLLTQAVSVANYFIDKGVIVSTTGDSGAEQAVPRYARLKGIPLAVLINEGSASASEIVSGAIRYYADRGDIRAVLIGERSYGKGSVQNVYEIARNAQMKLTTQYYKLPGGDIIHRLPGAKNWGVSPHVNCTMLPDQISQALTIRQDADVMPIDQQGNPLPGVTPPDPSKLLTDGIDLQLQYALVLLQSQTIGGADAAKAKSGLTQRQD